MSKSMKAIDPDERAKIMKLQNEIQNNNNNKVEWLYGGEKIDKEAYLLGKPIDKLITESEKNEAKAQQKFTTTVDIANKIREDPLFEIKKMEIESKKKLLENPLKIKKIKEMISQRSHEDDRRRKKEHKHKNKRRSSSSSSSDNSDDDKRRKRSRSRSRSSNRRDDRYGYHQTKRYNDVKHEKRDDYESKKDIDMYKKKIEDLKKIRESKQSSRDEKYEPKKLSEEEKRLKLQQMNENAKWRNDIRSTNIKRYKNDDKKEDEDRDKNHGPGHIFNSMMRDAYASTEERIKRNVKNIQRNESSYDKNFARR